MKIFIICCLLFIHVNMCIFIRGFRVSIRVSGIRGFGFGDGFPPESVSGSGSGFGFGCSKTPPNSNPTRCHPYAASVSPVAFYFTPTHTACACSPCWMQVLMGPSTSGARQEYRGVTLYNIFLIVTKYVKNLEFTSGSASGTSKSCTSVFKQK